MRRYCSGMKFTDNIIYVLCTVRIHTAPYQQHTYIHIYVRHVFHKQTWWYDSYKSESINDQTPQILFLKIEEKQHTHMHTWWGWQ